MKKTQKLSLANIQGKLSKDEMKKIMAGSGGGGPQPCGKNTDPCAPLMWMENGGCCTGYRCHGASGDATKGFCFQI